jgi:transposase-like protein
MEPGIIQPQFSDEDSARGYLEAKRWPDGAVCPHCGVVGESYRLKPTENGEKHARKGLWKCGGCREQFSVTVGTIFEDSHIPLHKWLLAIHLLCSSKKGISAHQLMRNLSLGSYRTAWFMAHRIRYAMTQEPLSSKLAGIVEVDETYIGGKTTRASRYRGEAPNPENNPLKNKEAVVILIERGGKIRSMHMECVTAATLKPVLRSMVDESAHVMTDESRVYRKWAGKEFAGHSTVNHSEKEYVRHENGVCITTNTAEGSFSLLKKGLGGIYQHVGKPHLHRYLTEFDFRYNAREVSDDERAQLALSGAGGKRLMYRDSSGRRTV